NALVFDAMPKSVRASTGARSPSFRTPYPFATTTASSFTIARPMPGTSKVCIARATHASRSGGDAGAARTTTRHATTAKAAKTGNLLNARRIMRGGYTETMADRPADITKSDEDWRRVLTPEQFHVLREHG